VSGSPDILPVFEFKGEVPWKYENGFDASLNQDARTFLDNIISAQE
jgi:hypothetical protein